MSLIADIEDTAEDIAPALTTKVTDLPDNRIDEDRLMVNILY